MNGKSEKNEKLDEALEETFPGSDPVPAGSGITGDDEGDRKPAKPAHDDEGKERPAGKP